MATVRRPSPRSPRRGGPPALLAPAVLAVGLALHAGPAAATVVRGLDREALVQGADGIVAGVVREVRAVPGPAPGPEILTRVVIDVTQTFKPLPEGAQDAVVLLQSGGNLDGRTLLIHGQARFEAGESVLVFIERLADGRLMPFGMAQGKFRLEEVDGRVAALRDLDGLAFSRPAGGKVGKGPAGPADPATFPERFDLADLEALVVRLTVPPEGGRDL